VEILFAILAFITFAGIGIALTMSPANEQSAKRARDLAAGKAPRARKDAAAEATAKRRAIAQDSLREMARQQKNSSRSLASVKAQLAQANLPVSAMQFYFIQIGVAIVSFIIASFVFGASWLAALIGAAGGGLCLFVLKFLVARRRKKFVDQLADSIDIIVRGVKSGLPLHQCLRIIATEAAEPVRSEFRQIVDGQAMGVPLEANLAKMYERMPLSEVNFFNIVLSIQQKTGGNLSEALGNLSSILRSRKMLKEKVKALASEAVASAMIIGSLPFIVMILVYLVRPAYIMLLFTTNSGNMILVAAGTMMSLGIIIMNRMVNFKF